MTIKFNIGLGTFRFFLAFLVAISHLWENMIGGPAAYAVWGFFVLSGFLMTLILTTKYGFTKQGIQNYAHNRILRIYPSYILGCIFGITPLLILNGTDTTVLNPAYKMPTQFCYYVHNILMLPLPTDGLFVPVAGALFVEFWAYALMIFAAKSKSAAWLGLIITLFTNIHYGFSPDTFPERYSFFTPSICGFFVGSLCVHYYQKIKCFIYPKTSLIVWCLHAMLSLKWEGYPWTYGLYTSLVCSAWVIISLYPIKTGKADKLFGDMSYIVYLIHTTIGMCFWWNYKERSFLFFLITFIITVFISYIWVILFERPLQKRFKRNIMPRKNVLGA